MHERRRGVVTGEPRSLVYGGGKSGNVFLLLTFHNLFVFLQKEYWETGASVISFKAYLWLLVNQQQTKRVIGVFLKDTETRYVDVNDPINNCSNN